MRHDAVEHVLELALTELSPSAADKARHRVALGLGPAGAPSPDSALTARDAGHGWRALRASGGTGWAAGALLLGAGIGLGFWLRGAVPAQVTAPAPSAMIQPAVAAAPAVNAPPVAAPPEALEPARRTEAPSAPPATARERTSARPERRAAVGAGSQAAPSTAQPFDAELALLQRVERALRANNPSLAVVLLDELDAGFSETRLGEEREAARRIAECQLQLPGWRQRAERFLSDQRGSMYAQRVRAACVLE